MDPIFLHSIIVLGGLGLLFGSGLGFVSRILHVEVDPKIEEIIEALSGANCGACGYAGCSDYAEAIVAGKADINRCVLCGREVQEEIAAIMGLAIGEVGEAEVAVVQCGGGHTQAKTIAIYQGIQNCAAAELVAGGAKACKYGCLGLGSCVQACPLNAMYMGDDRLPHVIEDKCTGCGICVSVCPRGIMALIPRSQKVYLACASQDRGKAVASVCKVGCIGCALCTKPKVTPSGSIRMKGNLPVIVKANADDLMVAKEKCPKGCFRAREVEKASKANATEASFGHRRPKSSTKNDEAFSSELRMDGSPDV